MQKRFKLFTMRKQYHSEKFCFIISVLLIHYQSINKGNDRGRQYRTGIYYQDEADFASYLHSGAGAGAHA